MKKLIFILLMTVAIIKPYGSFNIHLYQKETDRSPYCEFTQRRGKECLTIKYFETLSNEELSSRNYPSNKKFKFYGRAGKFNNKLIATDLEMQEYEQSIPSWAVSLGLKAVEITEEELKQEQAKLKEEQEIDALVEKIQQQFDSNKPQSCIIQ